MKQEVVVDRFLESESQMYNGQTANVRKAPQVAAFNSVNQEFEMTQRITKHDQQVSFPQVTISLLHLRVVPLLDIF